MVNSAVNPLVSIIVLNRNGRDFLLSCLESVYSRTGGEGASFEVITVDNASTDNSVSECRRLFPGVNLVLNSKNIGFASGNNKGAAYARGRYLVFLNNDVCVTEGWLDNLLRTFKKGGGDYIAACRILNRDGTEIDYNGGSLSKDGSPMHLNFGEKYKESTEEQREKLTFYACGAAMAVKKSDFMRLGGFDDDFFIYYEDVDLCWRAWICGMQVKVISDSVVLHKGSATMKATHEGIRRWLYERNKIYTFFKNAQSLQTVFMNLMSFLYRTKMEDTAAWTQVKSILENLEKGTPFPRSGAENLKEKNVIAQAVLNDVFGNLENILTARENIQKQRRMSDERIFRITDGLAPVESYNNSYGELVSRMERLVSCFS